MTSPIALILDRHFDSRLAGVAKEMPVWIVSSDENDAAVERARDLLGSAANITSLLVRAGETSSEVCLRALYAIDEHHGDASCAAPYDSVRVFGAAPVLLTPQVIEELGLSNVAKSDFGFTADKPRRRAALSQAK